MNASSATLAGQSKQDNSLSGLVSELTHKLAEYFQTQIALTRAELQQAGQRYMVAAVFGILAGVIGILGFLFLGITLFFLLSHYVDVTWAALGTTVFYLIIAGILSGAMMSEIRKLNTETAH